MSHSNRVKPTMTQNGKTAVMVGLSVGGALFIIAPGVEALAGLGFGIMLFAAGVLVANQLPLWELKVRATDSTKAD